MQHQWAADELGVGEMGKWAMRVETGRLRSARGNPRGWRRRVLRILTGRLVACLGRAGLRGLHGEHGRSRLPTLPYQPTRPSLATLPTLPSLPTLPTLASLPTLPTSGPRAPATTRAPQRTLCTLGERTGTGERVEASQLLEAAREIVVRLCERANHVAHLGMLYEQLVQLARVRLIRR